jgi:hypothetical protein
LSKRRMWIPLVLYTTLLSLLCWAGRAQPESLGWLALGLGLGSGLGFFGLKNTVFEPTPKGLFYTPHTHFGVALSFLFAARVAYRLAVVFAAGGTAPPAMGGFGRSPITLVVFGLLAGYSLTYAIGLMRWRFRVLRAKRRREALKSGTGNA